MSLVSIPCLFSAAPLSLQSEVHPTHLVALDWDAKQTEFSFHFSLATDSKHLLFATWVSFPQENQLHYNAQFKSGSFVEGLWKEDVVELFLGQEGSSFYQEFNLAPSGAWWSALFSSYRKEADTFCKPSHLEVQSNISTELWHARMLIPLTQLCIPNFRLKYCTCNVNAILGDDPRHYYSAAKLSTRQPDFHLVDEFLPLAN